MDAQRGSCKSRSDLNSCLLWSPPAASPTWTKALLLFGLSILLLGDIGWSQSPNTGTAPGPIYYLTLKASVNPITESYLVDHVNEAEQRGASMVIVQLDTPGGLLTSMKEIVSSFLNSTVPIVVWVGPAGAWAASAGTFITMAANVAVMAEGTTIGAAHPVNPSGTTPTTPASPTGSGSGNSSSTSPSPDAETQKVVNFTSEWASEIAKTRGRNQTWAANAVISSVTAGPDEALKENIIDLIANNRTELLNKLNGYQLRDGKSLVTQGVQVIDMPMNWREKLLNYLTDTNLVYVLLTIGTLALVYEFLSPTIGLGFIVGGISLLLAFMGLEILPVNWVGVALILFGVLLMVLDAFTPTHGILTTGGVVSMLIGSLTLFNISEPSMQLSLWTVFATVGTITFLFAFVVGKGLTAQHRIPVTGREGMVGSIGMTKGAIDPVGWVLVKGELWRAASEDGVSIQPRTEVIVSDFDGHQVRVRPRT